MSVSGLNASERATARTIIVSGARLMLDHASAIHYSEGSDRWQGIADRKRSLMLDYPTHADCSSTATWLLWNALHDHYGRGDVVNGRRWQSGWTGSMLAHGLHVVGALQVGDCVFYNTDPALQHVAVYIGGGKVFSHGSEAGPFKLPVHYRADYIGARRYL